MFSNVFWGIFIQFACQCRRWAVTHQIPLSTEFSRQEYWNWLLFPSPGDLPNPGIELMLPALQADSLRLSHQGNPVFPIPKVSSSLARQPQLLLHCLMLLISYLILVNYPRLTTAQFFLYPCISIGSNSVCYNANRSGLGHGDLIPPALPVYLWETLVLQFNIILFLSLIDF